MRAWTNKLQFLSIYVIDQAVYRFSTLQKSNYLLKCESSFWPSSAVQIQVVQMSTEKSESLDFLKDVYFFVKTDLSFASIETKFKNPITKTQNNFLVNTGFLVKLFQKKPKW